MATELLIFTHIPKAAGSTLTGLLRAQFRRDEIIDVTPVARPDLPERIRTLPPRTRLVVGHAPYGLHRHTDHPCRYFTILREPIERVISAYHYVRKNPDHEWHARFHAEQVTLAQFAREQVDIQTKYLAGCPRLKESAGPEELARALENLEHGYAAFGLVERFDESVLLLARAFGWPARAYVSRNVGRGGAAAPRIDPADLEALRETNALDRQLYDRALALFLERLAAQPPAFSAALHRLRRSLRWTARREAVASGIRKLLGRFRPAK